MAEALVSNCKQRNKPRRAPRCGGAAPYHGATMNDQRILDQITSLVEEEHRLRGAGGDPEATVARLKHVEEQLDQCWDLLRQRRAKREFGEDPDTAVARKIGTVESYRG